MTLKLDFFFLSPVEVVKVTAQNMQEVAEWCGGEVATTESRRVAGRMDSYVWVPTPKGTALSWAFPGMFITKRLVRTVKDDMRITFAVFRRDYFEKNYFDTPESSVVETWEKAIKMGLNPKGVKKSQARHPKMAGKPKPLELNVTVPDGASSEEVRGAVTDAVKVLEEQGVLHPSVRGDIGYRTNESEEMKLKPNEDDVEAGALKAIADSMNVEEADASKFLMTEDEYKASQAMQQNHIQYAQDKEDSYTSDSIGTASEVIANAEGIEVANKSLSDFEGIPQSMSPREVHDDQIQSVSMNAEAETIGGAIAEDAYRAAVQASYNHRRGV